MAAIILLSIFFVMMIGIGIWGMKKTSTLGDFFIGNRSIGPWISAFAFGTSYFSAVLFIGFAGKLGWGFGLDVLWIVLGNAFIGSLLAWLVLGRRTRIMTQNLNVLTMPEFLQQRFQSINLKIVSAVIIFVFLTPYSASVFKGLGYLFQINFNISYESALIIMIAITGIYLVLGGYFAVTLTDFIQGIIMIIGSIAMVAILVDKAGGFGEVLGAVSSKYHLHVPAAKQPNIIMLISLVFMTSFGTWGLPQMVQKFYSIKNENVIKKAAIVTTIFAIIIVFAAYFTGALYHVFYDKIPMTMTPKGLQPAFDQMIPMLLKAHLPEFLMAVILLLVLSASMSTLSSLVLVSASAIAIDLYKGKINPDISKENSVTLMRVLSGVFILISLVIALSDFGIIITWMSLSWGAVAGSFMAPYLFGLYWKKTTKAGVFAGIFTGLGLALILPAIFGLSTIPITSSVAMIVPFIVVPAVSLSTSKVDDQVITKAFDRI